MRAGLGMAAAVALLAAASAVGKGEGGDGTYRVEFAVQLKRGETGTFVAEIHPEWAPLGAARFAELLDEDFFPGCRFFRVVSGFMAQFGIHGNPEVSAKWRENKIKDDPVKETNAPYTMTFATSGKDSRTTQLFVNFADNARLDGMGFAPFAKIVSGTDVVDRINAKHGENPQQGRIQSEGNSYLKKEFPNLSYILSAKRLDAGQGDAASQDEL